MSNSGHYSPSLVTVSVFSGGWKKRSDVVSNQPLVELDPPPPGDLSTNLVPSTGARKCGVVQPVAQRRILGGAEAGRGQFPWSAVIHISSEVGS